MPGDIWRNNWGQIRIGINPNPRPIYIPIEEEQIFYDGIIQSLNCGSFTHYGTLIEGTSASGVTSVVTYSGGNGGSYPPQTVQSTGVTGLTATLDWNPELGFFLLGNGTLTYRITGTASSSGTASFVINVVGQTCTLTRTVLPIVELIYDGNGSTGGSEPQTVSGSGDKVVSTIGDLTKEGYSFVEWNTNPYGTGTTYVPGSTITLGLNSITLYAIWEFIPVLSYDGNGSIGGGPVHYVDMSGSLTEKIVAENGFEKTGYYFTEWNTSADGTGTTYLPASMITLSSSITLYAIWNAMLTLTYNGNGNTDGSGTQIVYGSGDKVVSGVGNLTKTGYTFYGWNTSADGTGTTYLAGSTITVSSSVTLYAIWNAMVTFTTSKLVGQKIAILVGSTTNYYKYIHNGSETVLDISALTETYQIGQNRLPVITVENSNGEFTIISCLEDGTPSGYIYSLWLKGDVYTDPVNGFTIIENKITSFNGVGLSGLSQLLLRDNLLTSFNLTGLTSLRQLEITGNPLTRSENDSILNQLNSSNINNGTFRTSNGRTSSGTTAYNSLISRGWTLTGVGVGNDWWN